MANSMTMTPYDHDRWRNEIALYYPYAVIQDDSLSSAFRERALNKGKTIAFFMRPHITNEGRGYVIEPENGTA